MKVKMQQRSRRMAFNSWHEFSVAVTTQARQVHGVISRFLFKAVCTALTTWRGITAQREAERAALTGAILRMLKSQIAGAWAAWQDLVNNNHAQAHQAQQVVSLLTDQRVRSTKTALRLWRERSALMQINQHDVCLHALVRWKTKAARLNSEQMMLSEVVRTVVESVMTLPLGWKVWSDVFAGAASIMKLVNLWRQLCKRLPPHLFRGLVEPWAGDCELLANALAPWIQEHLGVATSQADAAAIEGAFSEVRKVQRVCMILQLVAKQDFAAVLGAWQYEDPGVPSVSYNNANLSRDILDNTRNYWPKQRERSIPTAQTGKIVPVVRRKRDTKADHLLGAVYSHFKEQQTHAVSNQVQGVLLENHMSGRC